MSEAGCLASNISLARFIKRLQAEYQIGADGYI